MGLLLGAGLAEDGEAKALRAVVMVELVTAASEAIEEAETLREMEDKIRHEERQRKADAAGMSVEDWVLRQLLEGLDPDD